MPAGVLPIQCIATDPINFYKPYKPEAGSPINPITINPISPKP